MSNASNSFSAGTWIIDIPACAYKRPTRRYGSFDREVLFAMEEFGLITALKRNARRNGHASHTGLKSGSQLRGKPICAANCGTTPKVGKASKLSAPSKVQFNCAHRSVLSLIT